VTPDEYLDNCPQTLQAQFVAPATSRRAPATRRIRSASPWTSRSIPAATWVARLWEAVAHELRVELLLGLSDADQVGRLDLGFGQVLAGGQSKYVQPPGDLRP
jgi:hypothetical protein